VITHSHINLLNTFIHLLLLVKVVILQFIKSGNGYGELAGLAKLGDQVEIRSMGKGFIYYKRLELLLYGEQVQLLLLHHVYSRVADIGGGSKLRQMGSNCYG